MKRIISILLTVCLLLSSFATVVSATDNDAANDGYSEANITYVPEATMNAYPTVTALKGGTAPADAEVFTINSADELILFANLVNASSDGYTGKTFYINIYSDAIKATKTIDMTGKTMSPIGNAGAWTTGGMSNARCFRGTFDGQGVKITNLSMVVSELAVDGTVALGFFGDVHGAIIRNIVLDGSCSFRNTCATGEVNKVKVGALVACVQTKGEAVATVGELTADTLIENVKSSATVYSEFGYAGGLIGAVSCASANYAYVRYATVDGSVTAPYAGGLIGQVRARNDSDNPNFRKVALADYVASATLSSKSGKDVLANLSLNNATVVDLGGTVVDMTPAIPDTVGYSASRVEAVADLDSVPNIKTLVADNATGFDVDAYNEGTAWKITDAVGLIFFAKVVNASDVTTQYDFLEKTVYLAADIDMLGAAGFEPIGNDTQHSNESDIYLTRMFRGTFDGQGHTISNLVLTSNADGNVNVGLFGNVRGAVIKNFILDETCSFSYTGTSRHARVGAVVAKACANAEDGHVGTEEDGVTFIPYIIENVKNQANVSSTQNAGGIVGITFAVCNLRPVIRYCTNEGKVTGGKNAGGIVGAMNGGVQGGSMNIDSCVSTGDITGNYYAAGIVSNIDNKGDLNTGTPEEPVYTPRVLNVTNCYTDGVITGDTPNAIAVSTPAKDADSTAVNLVLTSCDGSRATVITVKAEPEAAYGNTAIDYTGKVIGYDPAAVGEKKDLSNVLPICAYLYAPVDTKEYKISTPEDLIFFSEIVNSSTTFEYTTIYLENDIDMTGKTMKPIGLNGTGVFTDKTKCNYFRGIFDGQGYVIDNLVIESTTKGSNDVNEIVLVGLFGMVRGATLKNIVLGSGCKFSYEGPKKAIIGSIAAYTLNVGSYHANSEIVNCYSAATVIGPETASGILGWVDGMTNALDPTLVKNCTNAGSVTSTGSYAAGIVGYNNWRKLDIMNCRNTGTITLQTEKQTLSSGAAGIYARPYNDSGLANRVHYCINNGEIVGPGTIGGIVAIVKNSGTEVVGCTNTGVLTAPVTADNVGPMFGHNAAGTISNMQNNAAIETDVTNVAITFTTSFPNYTEIEAAHKVILDSLKPSTPVTPPEEEDPDNDLETEPVTKAPETSAPTGGSETKAPTAGEKDEDEKKGGCGATVAGGALALILTVGLAGAMLRKKED